MLFLFAGVTFLFGETTYLFVCVCSFYLQQISLCTSQLFNFVVCFFYFKVYFLFICVYFFICKVSPVSHRTNQISHRVYLFIPSLGADRRPAGEGANIYRCLVPYTRDAMGTKSRIEFIYLYICINRGPHARAFWNFGPGK